MADNVVDILLKAKVDNSDVKSDIDSIAKNSATALQKAYTDLFTTLKDSTKDFAKNLDLSDPLDNTQKQVRRFVRAFQEVSTTTLETGLLPEGINTKMYKLLSDVNRLAKEYRNAYNAAVDFTSNAEKVPTTAYAKLLEDIQKVSRSLNGARQQQIDYNTALQQLGQISTLTGELRYGEKTIEYYEKLEQKIEDTKEKLEQLRALNFDKNGVAKYVDVWGNALGEGIKGAAPIQEQDAYIAKLREVEKELANQERVMRTVGKADTERIMKIRELQSAIRDTFGGELVTEQQIRDAIKLQSQEVDKLTEKYKNLKQQQSEVPESQRYSQDFATEKDKEVFASMLDYVRKVKEELVVAATRVNELEQATQKAGRSMSQMRNVVWSISRVLGNLYTIGLDVWRSAKQIANIYKTIWNYVKKVVDWFKKLRTSIKGTADEHKKSWKQMLRDVLRYSLGIRSLFALFRRLRSAIKEAFKAMAEQIPEVNKTLSEMLSSFNQMKASLATAFEPIISALAAGLNRILSLISQLLTYVGMFFAALSGRGYVYKANKSMTSFADAAGGAADNVKELNKQLQGFDELNNLTTNDKKDSGSGGAGPLAEFEKTPIPEWIQNLADKLKDIFNQIMKPIREAWRKVGDYVIAAWRRAAYALKALLSDVLRDFLLAWSKWGEPIFTRIFEIAGDIGNIFANIIDAIREAWNANENGVKIWNAILEIIYKIVDGIRAITIDMVRWTHSINLTPAMTAFREWLESLIPVAEFLMDVLYDLWNDAIKPILDWTFNGENSGIARLFRIFRDFNTKVNWQKLRTNLDKVWKAIGRFGKTVGEGLLIFIERLSDRLANWVNSDNFENTIDKIVEFLDNIEPGDIADDLDQILTITKNILVNVWDAIKFVIDHKDQILDTLEWASEHLKGILATFIGFKSVIDLGRFAANIYLMITAIQKLLGVGALGGVAEASASAFGEAGLSGAVAGAGAKIGELFGSVSGFLGLIGAIIAYIVWLVEEFKYLYENNETFRQSVDDTITLFNDNIGSIIENMQELWQKTSDLLEKLAPIKDAILNAFGPTAIDIFTLFGDSILLVTGLLSGLSDVLVALVDLVSGDFDSAAQHISNAFTTVSDNFKQMADNIVNHLDSIASAIGFINPIIGNFINILNDVIGLIRTAADKIRDFGNSISSGGSFRTSVSSYVTNRMQSFSVPRLAQGAVIPPNNEFLAVLGDQNRGTNIESPLSTMVEAFNQANKGGSEAEIALLQEQNDLLRQLLNKEFGISESAIFKSVRQSNSQYRKQNGVSAFA